MREATRPKIDVTLAEALSQLPLEGQKLVESIRTGQPVRSSTAGRRSVSGRFSSLKMGKTIQFESRTLEGAACWQYEEEPAVHEFYDQPSHLKVGWRRDGRGLGAVITPDFFVIRRTAEGHGLALGFEEWKLQAELEHRREKDPERYVLHPDGMWVDRAATEAALALGLGFRICTEQDVSENLVRNVATLFDYYTTPYVVAVDLRDAATDLVRRNPVTLHGLLSELPAMNIDAAFALIADGTIWTDLRAAPLKERERVLLFASREAGLFVAAAPRERVARGEVVLIPGSWLTWVKGSQAKGAAAARDQKLGG